MDIRMIDSSFELNRGSTDWSDQFPAQPAAPARADWQAAFNVVLGSATDAAQRTVEEQFGHLQLVAERPGRDRAGRSLRMEFPNGMMREIERDATGAIRSFSDTGNLQSYGEPPGFQLAGMERTDDGRYTAIYRDGERAVRGPEGEFSSIYIFESGLVRALAGQDQRRSFDPNTGDYTIGTGAQDVVYHTNGTASTHEYRGQTKLQVDGTYRPDGENGSRVLVPSSVQIAAPWGGVARWTDNGNGTITESIAPGHGPKFSRVLNIDLRTKLAEITASPAVRMDWDPPTNPGGPPRLTLTRQHADGTPYASDRVRNLFDWLWR